MRLVLPGMMVCALLGVAPAALAGPTCEDRAGEVVRCEDPRAMPPGWAPPLEEQLKHTDRGPPEPTAVELGGVFALILMLFALIALMPDFDGWGAGASDQGGDAGDERN